MTTRRVFASLGPMRSLSETCRLLWMIASTAGVSMSVSRPAAPAGAPLALVMHENSTLGYRVGLPEGYRRSRSLVLAVGQEHVGHDAYVNRTEAKEVELCVNERKGDGQSFEREFDVRIDAYRDIRGVSVANWIRVMNLTLAHALIRNTRIDGHEAAQVVDVPSGTSAFYVIRANQRIYLLTREKNIYPSRQPSGWLDEIAASFRAIPSQDSAPVSIRPSCGSQRP